MGDTLNHLEKVIRDVPNGSLTVEPLNHIEKVIQEVGQEIAESSGGGGKLYEHNIFINNSTYGCYVTFKIINDSETPFDYDTIRTRLYDNGQRAIATGMICNGWINTYNFNCWSIFATSNAIKVAYHYNDSTSLPSIDCVITDTVVQILGGE